MVQSGVVQSPFRRGRGVANKRGLRVRKVKVKNWTEKLLPSWPTLTLAKCYDSFFSGFVFKGTRSGLRF